MDNHDRFIAQVAECIRDDACDPMFGVILRQYERNPVNIAILNKAISDRISETDADRCHRFRLQSMADGGDNSHGGSLALLVAVLMFAIFIGCCSMGVR